VQLLRDPPRKLRAVAYHFNGNAQKWGERFGIIAYPTVIVPRRNGNAQAVRVPCSAFR
jgi:hypothetical protein